MVGGQMKIKTLLLAGMKRQKNSIVAIIILMLLMTLSFTMAVTIYLNAGSYIKQEMERLGYGDLTAWVSECEDISGLVLEIEEQELVERVSVQPLIFSAYSIHEYHSDNEGELISYDPEHMQYRFLNTEQNGYQAITEIKPGEIYLSPVLRASAGVEIGDTVSFELERSGQDKAFTVAGFFEDPFMGSSMIDMKSFLICKEDYVDVQQRLETASDFNILGRESAMLHIFGTEEVMSVSELNQQLNASTSLGRYSEMVYSFDTIYGFMLILQNIFTGFLIVFAILLLVVFLIVTGNGIRNAITQEYQDIGILKTVGCTAAEIRRVQVLQYGIPILTGMVLGILLSIMMVRGAVQMTVTSTGILMPTKIPVEMIGIFLVGILFLLFMFIWKMTHRILEIRPIEAIQGREEGISEVGMRLPISSHSLHFSMALRQLSFGWKKYIGVCLIMAMLTLFASVVGRMNSWIGAQGEGLMNAFSVAEHDLGVQPTRTDVDMQEIEKIIGSYSAIRSTYQIAMQSGTVNGVNYTINVLDQPERFHMLSGQRCEGENQIVVTEFVAEDLGIAAGDEVTVSSGGKTGIYQVTGIYECANGMGANVGMSRKGYAEIGDVNEPIWCYHYIFENGEVRDAVMEELSSRYRVEVALHTNSWSGLDGIVNTLHILVAFMYMIVAIVVCIVILLSANRVLHAEQKDLAIYKSCGFTSVKLEISFGLRYGIAAAVGAVVGLVMSGFLANYAVTWILRNFGIGEFKPVISLWNIVFPAVVIILLALAFALLASYKIKKVPVTQLLADE